MGAHLTFSDDAGEGIPGEGTTVRLKLPAAARPETKVA
jgi:hypothetical protein